MTDPVIECADGTADDLWADDELSDDAIDRVVGQGGKFSGWYKCGSPS